MDSLKDDTYNNIDAEVIETARLAQKLTFTSQYILNSAVSNRKDRKEANQSLPDTHKPWNLFLCVCVISYMGRGVYENVYTNDTFVLYRQACFNIFQIEGLLFKGYGMDYIGFDGNILKIII